nr:DUF523 domain-containing protein [uncultured Eisenbergiella sp.]
MNILVSACLLGVNCRYDGTGCLLPVLEELKKKHHLIPVCPEAYGGLATPRPPAEIRDGRVINRNGEDVTAQYRKGAGEAWKLARFFDCKAAILKERSPACGYGRIHNGRFDGGMTEGNGVLARLLAEEGIPVLGESETEKIRAL